MYAQPVSLSLTHVNLSLTYFGMDDEIERKHGNLFDQALTNLLQCQRPTSLKSLSQVDTCQIH